MAQAGYVRSRRAKRDARQRVWLALTPEGRDGFESHVAALHEIVGHAAEPEQRGRRVRRQYGSEPLTAET